MLDMSKEANWVTYWREKEADATPARNTAFEHKPGVWRSYKEGEISYRDYLEAGRYELPTSLSLAELSQYSLDTPRAADL